MTEPNIEHDKPHPETVPEKAERPLREAPQPEDTVSKAEPPRNEAPEPPSDGISKAEAPRKESSTGVLTENKTSEVKE